jgi:hypothetical protein
MRMVNVPLGRPPWLLGFAATSVLLQWRRAAVHSTSNASLLSITQARATRLLIAAYIEQGQQRRRKAAALEELRQRWVRERALDRWPRPGLPNRVSTVWMGLDEPPANDLIGQRTPAVLKIHQACSFPRCALWAACSQRRHAALRTSVPTDRSPARPSHGQLSPTWDNRRLPRLPADAAALRAFDSADWLTCQRILRLRPPYPAGRTGKPPIPDTMYQHRATLGDPTDPRAVHNVQAASEDARSRPPAWPVANWTGQQLLAGRNPPRPWWQRRDINGGVRVWQVTGGSGLLVWLRCAGSRYRPGLSPDRAPAVL